MPEKDYSGTPLPKKLGIKEGSRVAIVGAPGGFAATLTPMPAGVEVVSRVGGHLDVVIVFATRRASLERRLGPAVRALEPDGGVWLCWPKKAAKVDTDLTFEVVQALGLEAGLVDNKSAAIDAVYQGLRFVYRLKDRPAPAYRGAGAGSQSRRRSPSVISRAAPPSTSTTRSAG